ncbi:MULTISPECIES: MFS transporter [unclassified Paraburkholderia]|uniref:MFS transporter n=1 Tax=unclassified Paraburkholderia TaxID=2615204 RepID=UPI002AB18A25|nr:MULTISPECIES: MFS transporter [unclassified Paraburkholderia]
MPFLAREYRNIELLSGAFHVHTSLSESTVTRPAAGSAEDRVPSPVTLIFATALGNGLEVFDFTVFSFFASYVGSAFFPAKDPLVSLLLAVGTFAAGFFARPLGAMLIGGLADRVGRRAAMTLSIWLMAAGTAAIGLCPTYATLGVAAPLIVLCGRLLQGFAAGGEIGASTTYLMESGAQRQRGSMVGWQGVSQGAAAILGALCGLLLSRLMDPQTLSSWGWRLPFLIGLLIAPVGYYIRRHLPERHAAASANAHASPIRLLVTQHPKQLATAVLVILSQTVTMYVLVYFVPSYLSRVMDYPASTGFTAAISSSLAIAIASFAGGRIADRVTRRKPLVFATTTLILILCLPSFWLLMHVPNVYAVAAVCATISALLGLGSVASTVLIIEMFPATVRASGFSIAYAIGVTLFGGTAQFVTTSLIVKTGSPLAAGYYVFACLVVTWLTVWRLRERSV